MKRQLLQSPLISVTCLLVIQCTNSGSASQFQPTPAYTATIGSNANAVFSADDEAEIDGKTAKLVGDLTLESILKQSAPEVWLVFACESQSDCVEGKMKKELPIEVKKMIEEYWKSCLSIQYKSEIEKYENAQEQYNSGILHFNKGMAFQKTASTFFIEAPNGKRKISSQEALNIVGFLNGAARITIQEAKSKSDK